MKGDLREEVGAAKVVEKIEPPSVISIGVCIAADEVGGTRIDGTNFFNMGFELDKHGGELLVLTSSGEIEDCVEGGDD